MINNQEKREADSIKIIGVVGVFMIAVLAAVGTFELIDLIVNLFA